MILFISGGAKNGKSMKAQYLARYLAGNGGLYYLATMHPGDDEDLARIARHRREREGWGFSTVERFRDIGALRPEPGCYLLDSVTALLSNEMFPPEGFDPGAPRRVMAGLRRFLTAAEHAVVVSDAIGSDAAVYDSYTEAYRRGLAETERDICRYADVVAEACAGNFIVYKGALPK